jgi:alkaline phosphatase D
LEAEGARELLVCWTEVPNDAARDFTHSFVCPQGGAALKPSTRYRVRVYRGDEAEALHRGAFETAPEGWCADRFAIAVLSCNQPFSLDGRLLASAQATASVLPQAFRDYGVKRVLMLGDQMYADYPKTLSLFSDAHWRSIAPHRESLRACERAEVRRLYQERYRVFWGVPSFRQLQSEWPCYMVPDDHEIFDNFGSAPEHREGALGEVAEGALDAVYDYEGTRVRDYGAPRPPFLHATLEYGPVAVFLLDLRSQKRATAAGVEVVGEDQLEALTAYLERHAEKPVVLVGISVPIAHLPSAMARVGSWGAPAGGDLEDRWDHPRARRSRDRLLERLVTHQLKSPRQRIILLSGDIHTAFASRLEFRSAPVTLHQLVSSPVSHVESGFVRALASVLPRLSDGACYGCGRTRFRARLMAGVSGADSNPFAGLNAGIVEFTRGSQGWDVQLIIVTGDGSNYREVFRGRVT